MKKTKGADPMHRELHYPAVDCAVILLGMRSFLLFNLYVMPGFIQSYRANKDRGR